MTGTEESPGAERPRRLQPLASFRYRNYRWLWAANACGGAVAVTQGFLITWLIIEALDSVHSRGAVDLVGALPILLLGLLAGRLADRRDRRLLLMGSHVAVALVLVLVAILGARDLLSLGRTVFLVALGATAAVFGQPVRLALIPAVVPKERILNANTLDTLGGGLGGMALIPVTLGLSTGLPIEGAFVILAAVSALGALFLIPLRLPPREAEQDGDGAAGEHSPPVVTGGGIIDGFRFLWRTVELRLLFVLLLTAILIGPWAALTFVAAEELFDITLQQWALLNLFLGVGTIVSTIALAFVRRLPRAGTWYGFLMMASALAAVGVWFSPSYGLAGFLMALYGLALGVRGLLFLALVQAHAPIAVMGRVMGIYVVVPAAAGLLGPLIVRGGQALFEDDGWMVFSGIVLVGVVALVLAWSPALRRMPSLPDEPAAPADERATVATGPG